VNGDALLLLDSGLARVPWRYHGDFVTTSCELMTEESPLAFRSAYEGVIEVGAEKDLHAVMIGESGSGRR
jgi:hypothetical protein